MKVACLVATIGCLTVPLRAQSPVAIRAAATITEADVKRRIHIVAHDSMGGRDTPSRGLDLTAQWMAGEFRQLGLKPAGASAGFVLPYQITTRRVVPAGSAVSFTGPGNPITLQVGKDASVAVAGGGGEVPVVLLGGGIDSATSAQLKGKAVVWLADWSAGFPSDANQVLQAAFGAGAKLMVVVVNNPAAFGQLAGQIATETVVGTGPREGLSVFLANDAAVAVQSPEAVAQLAQIRAATTPTVVPAPDWTAKATIRDTIVSTLEAPNVAGVIEGTDPVLKNEYVVISAHLDHMGLSPTCKSSSDKDRVCNGADDNGSGTVGIVELAEAFAEAGARPKRSILFLGVSGEEKGLWGSAQFVENPPVPVAAMVANLNMDMIGRNWKDTVVAIGKEHSDLGTTLAKVAGDHPGLKMAAIDDRWPEENLYFRSDHYNFAAKGVPALFFTSGLHDDYHAVTDTPDKLDAEKEARILKLIFHLATAIGNAPDRPKWNPASYEKIVKQPNPVP